MGIEFARILLLEDSERESMRQDQKRLLGPLVLVCIFISVSSFGCVSYDSYSRSVIRPDYSSGQFESYYHPGMIFDLTEKERYLGQRVVSSEQFGRSPWPVVQRQYDNITSFYIDTYQIYTDDDQRIG